LLATN